jgi:hypothetical protein
MGNCPPGWGTNSAIALRPWETVAIATPPGLTSGTAVIYNRVVDVHRTVTQETQTPSIGDTGYSGETQPVGPATGQEQILYTNVPAVISVKTPGRAKGPLPADVVYKAAWTVGVPVSAIPEFGIRDRDIIIDDDGYRYIVGAAGWTALQWNLECIRLEA